MNLEDKSYVLKFFSNHTDNQWENMGSFRTLSGAQAYADDFVARALNYEWIEGSWELVEADTVTWMRWFNHGGFYIYVEVHQ
jgi:hypothetical protein